MYYIISYRLYGGKCGNMVVIDRDAEEYIQQNKSEWTNWSVWKYRNKSIQAINEIDLIAEGKQDNY